MIRFLFISIVTLAFGFQAYGQQLPQYSQYMFNLYLINPAVAGTSDYYHINTGYRRQWVGIEGAPVTFYISGHGHIGKEAPKLREIHKNQNSWHHGLGFMATADKTGGTYENAIFNTYKFYVTYAFDMKIGEVTRLAFGSSVGIQQISVNQEGARFNEGISPVVFNSTSNLVFPDLNVGIFMYHKLWYIGASGYSLFENRLKNTPFSEPTGTNSLVRHYFATGGGVVRLLRDPEIDMIPSVVLKLSEHTSPAPISADFNVKITYKELLWKNDHLIWAGFSYRTQDGLVFMAGFRVKSRYEFGYAYDYTLSPLQTNSYGSHEIMLGYRIVPKQRVLSPSDYWY